MQCIANNVFGTRNAAAAAVAAQVNHFILVSTDKAVNPTSFMGASKRLAELVCQDFASKQSTTNCNCPVWQCTRFVRVGGAALQTADHRRWSSDRHTCGCDPLFHDDP